MATIEEQVIECVANKLAIEPSEVKVDSSFSNDLGADSLDTVELIMEFENKFGITIPDEDAEKIVTVSDAIAYVEAHKA